MKNNLIKLSSKRNPIIAIVKFGSFLPSFRIRRSSSRAANLDSIHPMCGISLEISSRSHKADHHSSPLESVASLLKRRGRDHFGTYSNTLERDDLHLGFQFLSSVLHMRGTDITPQPIILNNGDVFVMNGEIFGGLEIPPGISDSITLAQKISNSKKDPNNILELVCGLLGPYSFIYYDSESKSFFFARDPLGRRSLLLHTPSSFDDSFILSSVGSSTEGTLGNDPSTFISFEELPPKGLYQLRFSGHDATSDMWAASDPRCLWASSYAQSAMGLFLWPWLPEKPVRQPCFEKQQLSVPPSSLPSFEHSKLAYFSSLLLQFLAAAVKVRVQSDRKVQAGVTWSSLPDSIRDRFRADLSTDTVTSFLARNAIPAVLPNPEMYPNTIYEDSSGASVAILFSGGLDSMVLARLAHEFVPAAEPIDLLNVCFAKNHLSPDRLASIEGLSELKKSCPARKWQLIFINESFDAVLGAANHTKDLLYPCGTHMDFNIGSALWFAARGIGFVDVSLHHQGGEGSARVPKSILQAELRYGADEGVREDGGHHLSKFQLSATGDAAPESSADPHGDVASLVPQAEIDQLLHSSPTGFSSGELILPEKLVEILTEFESLCEVEPVPVVASLPVSTLVVPTEELEKEGSHVEEENHALIAAPTTDNPEKDHPVRASSACAGVLPGGAACSAGRHGSCARGMCRGCCLAAAAPSSAESQGVVCHVHKPRVSKVPQRVKEVESECAPSPSSSFSPSQPPSAVLIRSSARILLDGLGADEQLAGYGRHRSCFRAGGWAALRGELAVDVDRLWKRNLGRDDRILSDHSREARFPYLDENLMALIKALPLPCLADLRLAQGVGDKRILRVAARMLNLPTSSKLVKRAIHFGSRIAKQSNVMLFGSNRAAKGDAVFKFDDLQASEDCDRRQPQY
jgi:asparagine synthetase B (glutamine-hydrolysing)